MARSKQCSSVSAWLVGCICQYRNVIGVVGVGYCFCGVPPASFLCQLKQLVIMRIKQLITTVILNTKLCKTAEIYENILKKL